MIYVPSPVSRRHGLPQGFTLLELMIVVAVIGILASLALAYYSNYIDTARTTSLQHNYEVAVSTARSNYVAAVNLTSLGANVSAVIPADSAGWVEMMNQFPATAPDGGLAYESGTGNTANGAVGIVYAGTYADNSSIVTIHRPAYNGLAAMSTSVIQANL